MISIYKIIAPLNVVDSICLAQGATEDPGFEFIINGSLSNTANTVAIRPGEGEQQVTLTTSGGDVGKVITVTGTDINGIVVSEDVTLVNVSGADSSATFVELTSAVYKTGASLVGDVRIGWTQTGNVVTQALPLNVFQSTFNVTLGIAPFPVSSITASNLATMEYSLDDPFDRETFPSVNNDASWRSPSSLVDPDDSTKGLDVSADTALDGPVTMVRGVIQGVSGTQAWRYSILQGQNT